MVVMHVFLEMDLSIIFEPRSASELCSILSTQVRCFL